MTNVQVPKLKLPFRVTNGAAEVVEQDSFEEVRQCVEVLVRTPVGTRIDEPSYGVRDQTFKEDPAGSDIEDLVEAIEEWEPRAVYTLDDDDVEDLLKKIHINLDVQEGI
jgi:phage baseplate assembly protein W